MKLTNVALYANDLEVAELSFRSPGSNNPYVAETIIGLDADEIVPTFQGFGTTSRRRQRLPKLKNRTVTIRVLLQPQNSAGLTVSELRDELYKAIGASRDGTMQVHFRENLTTLAMVEGSIVKLEAPHFERDARVQITLECDDGMLRSIEPTEVDVVYLTDANTVRDSTSTAPHGVSMGIKFVDASTTFLIRDSSTPEWFLELTPGDIDGDTGFLVDDELYISSEYGTKGIYIMRYPAVPIPTVDYSIHVVNKLTLGSSWPILYPGDNDIEIVVDGEFEWLKFEHKNVFWGV